MDNSHNNYDDRREDRRRWREERRAQRMARFSHSGIYAGHTSSHGHIVLGIIILLVGTLFLLENLGYFYVGDIWQFWPVILIALGIGRILDSRSLNSALWGATVGGIGLILLANNLDYLPWRLWHFVWPALLILWGLILLLRGFERRGYSIGTHSFVDQASTISNNVLNEVVVFGGIHRKIEASDFQGGEARAVFGGIEIDLRSASTTKDIMEIRASAIFGGIELKVPDSWEVTVRGAGVLGGYEDKTHPAAMPESGKRPHLVVLGEAVFGGVTVRN
jgi:predicted membrane protein